MTVKLKDLPPDEQYIIKLMCEYKLKRGQMLIVTPSVIRAFTRGTIVEDGDRGIFIYDKSEWNK